MFRLVVTVLGAAALWIFFVADVKPEEMIVGAICTLLTVAFTVYLASQGSLQIRLRFGDVIQIWRLPGYVITDAWEIVTILAMDILHQVPAESLFRAAPFEANHEEPVAFARRILAVAYTTATPSFVVIGIDLRTHRILFHQLRKSDVPIMTQRLGAQA